VTDHLARIRAHATRKRQTVEVLCDGEVVAQIEAVEDELDRLDEAPATTDRRLSTKPNETRRKELLAERDRLIAEAVSMTLYLVFEGLPGTAYQTLTAQHPPRRGDDGKTVPADIGGVNSETFARPAVYACVIGHRERPEADAPVLPLDAETLPWLLGTDEEPGFATDRQIQLMAQAAIDVNRKSDAVPKPRPRSVTGKSASA
jgi:hypothetical protein